jgi:hypothetical protein
MTRPDSPIKGSSSSESTIKPYKEAFWATEKLPKHKNKVNSKDLCNFKF